jgi:hypothetical protein
MDVIWWFKDCICTVFYCMIDYLDSINADLCYNYDCNCRMCYALVVRNYDKCMDSV